MSQPSQPETSRNLDWDGCLNVRDLGGHPTADGGETRWRSIVRADSIRQLSEAGWKAAVDYGIRTAIDLRGHHERADDPPADASIEVIHAPFMEADEEDTRRVASELAEIERLDDPVAITSGYYLTFLKHFSENAAAGIRAVAHAPAGGVVVHCVGGKDRTGLLCAFLLDLAGVPLDAIAADYAISEERLRPRHEAWLAAAETDLERERIRRVSRTPAAAMVGVFEELERRYGGIAGYLRDAGGLTGEELEVAGGRLR